MNVHHDRANVHQDRADAHTRLLRAPVWLISYHQAIYYQCCGEAHLHDKRGARAGIYVAVRPHRHRALRKYVAMLRVTVLLCLATLAACQTTAVSRCVRFPGDLPLNTYVEGCETPPCLLPQGQDAVINIVFRAPYAVRSMTSIVRAFITSSSIPIPYPLGEQAVTCNFLTNTYCPILEGEVVTYTLKFFIESFFPADIQVFIEFWVVDEAAAPLFCVRFPLQVVQSATALKPFQGNMTLNAA